VPRISLLLNQSNSFADFGSRCILVDFITTTSIFRWYTIISPYRFRSADARFLILLDRKKNVTTEIYGQNIQKDKKKKKEARKQVGVSFSVDITSIFTTNDHNNNY
jgi:hypothetical protein